MNTPTNVKVADDRNDSLPSLEEVSRRLEAARDWPQPWLSPEAFAAAKALADSGVSELSGPLSGEIPQDD